MDDLTNFDRESDIPAFNQKLREELRERHPILLDSGKDSMNIQSEDEDED